MIYKKPNIFLRIASNIFDRLSNRRLWKFLYFFIPLSLFNYFYPSFSDLYILLLSFVMAWIEDNVEESKW